MTNIEWGGPVSASWSYAEDIGAHFGAAKDTWCTWVAHKLMATHKMSTLRNIQPREFGDWIRSERVAAPRGDDDEGE